MIIKRVITIDYGHRLPEYFGPCSNHHGHLGRIICSFEGITKSDGMIEDFSYLKEVMMREIHAVADHCYIIWKGDTEEFNITLGSSVMFQDGDPKNVNLMYVGISTLEFMKASGKKILVTDDPPTAETLAKYFGEKVRMAILDKPFYLYSLEWWETPNNCAVYFPSEERVSFDTELTMREQLDQAGY